MVAFNNQENGQQSSGDRAMEKIYEEMDLIGKERMDKLMSSILEMVSIQIESQAVNTNGVDGEGDIDLPTVEVIDLVWDIHSEFFGL